ncbi:uncharacterized protein LOC113507180 [Trichoplusia ni]|uniref:Uncharacterized protein LOC113507180 n=1 Tax=Trichoplusia ni TaxID=7111 RepID=A0A7E5X047_TRINI|nr:uncharacterized protein LOC113507180 [Trichoplusia ni]
MDFKCCRLRTKNVNKELICSQCCDNYHIKCIFPNKDEVPNRRSMSSWLCSGCSEQTDIAMPQVSPSQQNVTIKKNTANSKEDIISISKEELRSIVKEEINAAFSNINCTLLELKSEVTDLQNNVKFLSAKYDTVMEKINCLDNKAKKINTLELEVSDLRGQLKSIEGNIEKQEQWGRRSNIEIIGLPEKNGENLMNALSKLATYAKCPFNPQTDIDFVTRVAHLNKDLKKPKPVIVRFLARYKKDEFLSRLREFKDIKASDIGYSENTSRIYFNEHLTSCKKMLLNKVKKLAVEKQYKYVWVKNFSILARKTDSSTAIHISSEDDLKKLV